MLPGFTRPGGRTDKHGVTIAPALGARTLGRNDLVRMGQTVGPWQFLPAACQALRQLPEDAGLRFLVGVRLVMRDGLDLFAWPTDRKAYGRLCRLLSLGQRRAEKGQCLLTLEDVRDFAEGSLFALPQDHAAMILRVFRRFARIAATLLSRSNTFPQVKEFDKR